MANFEDVKTYVLSMALSIALEDANEQLIVVQDEERGIGQMVLKCQYPILTIEQMIMPVPHEPGGLFRRLLQMNRNVVHGAFALDEEGTMVLFRDSLQLDNLDQNELAGAIEALSLALAEHSGELVSYLHG